MNLNPLLVDFELIDTQSGDFARTESPRDPQGEQCAIAHVFKRATRDAPQHTLQDLSRRLPRTSGTAGRSDPSHCS
jgi:hypothetical protein